MYSPLCHLSVFVIFFKRSVLHRMYRHSRAAGNSSCRPLLSQDTRFLPCGLRLSKFEFYNCLKIQGILRPRRDFEDIIRRFRARWGEIQLGVLASSWAS